MTVMSPRHDTRDNPHAAGLDAQLRHAGGWKAISITESPQLLELVVTNRTTYPVHCGVAQISLLFRPGVLMDLDHLALAPQSEADWVLTREVTDAEGDVRLRFDSANTATIAPGAALIIRLAGVSANPEGGSRATRVQADYAQFFHDEGPEITGSHLLHLPILRRHAPEHMPMTLVRGGSAARSGPFIAGFVGGNGALNDGKSPNPLTLRVMNISGRNVRLSNDGDAASRLHLSWHMGRENGEWGLVSSHGDHVTLSLPKGLEEQQQDKGWQIDGLTLRCVEDIPLAHGDYLDLGIILHSQAQTGQAQLVLTFENLQDHDDGELVLLVDLGPMSATGDAVDIVKPLNLYGADARISFHAAETFEVTQDSSAESVASVSVNRTEDDAGRLQIKGSAVAKTGQVDVSIGSVLGSFVGFQDNAISAFQPDTAGLRAQELKLQTGGGTVRAGGDFVALGSGRFGTDRGQSVYLSENEIQSYQNTYPHTLKINPDGGDTQIGGALHIDGDVRITSTKDADKSGTGALIIGDQAGKTIAIDDNEMMALNGTDFSPLYLNYKGEATHVGGVLTAGKSHLGGKAGYVVTMDKNNIKGQHTKRQDIHAVYTDAELHFQSKGKPSSFRGRVSVASTGSTTNKAGGLIVGSASSAHIAVSTNEISARKGTAARTLHLNFNGGDVKAGGEFMIKKVEPYEPGGGKYDVTWNHNTGAIGREGSSRRFKKNIAHLRDDFAKILEVKPRRYNMRVKYGDPDFEHFGYIAEELHDLGLTRLVIYDEDGRPDGVRYKMLAIYLTEVVKTQDKRLAQLEAKVAKLAKRK